jgi:hypothetical protein
VLFKTPGKLPKTKDFTLVWKKQSEFPKNMLPQNFWEQQSKFPKIKRSQGG